MCGIAGFLGTFTTPELESMQQSILHRGPDQSGCWHDEQARVGLAFTRLAIIDLHERGSQPMWDQQKRAVIIFNGEVYNYREIREELVRDGCVFNSTTDTEVVLNLYLRDGPSFLSRLNGMFALAIWDTRNREMLVARDGLGIKPFYYTETPRGFAFASEMKALLRLKDVDRGLDHHAMVDYFGFSFCPAPRTILKACKKLEPGHAIRLDARGRRQEFCFYRLPCIKPDESIKPAAAIEELRFLLERAVKRQMVADVEVGAFLSGGLDSSSLAYFARAEVRNGKLPCFTINPTGGDAGSDGHTPDYPYAQRVARFLGTPLHTVEIASSMLLDLDKMIFHLDEPAYDPAALNTFYITRLAREQGIKVLLSGAGGDDIFSGYRRHVALWLEGSYAWLPAGGRRVLRSLAGHLPVGNPTMRRLGKFLRYADREATARLIGHYYWLDEDWIREILSPEFMPAWPAGSMEGTFRSALADCDPGAPLLNQMLYLDTKFFLTDHNLNYTDKMSMANGVEVRVPFLDPDLVAFAAKLPLPLKQRRTTGKWILREAMRPYLPPEVITRPKSGFGAPIRSWINGPLSRQVEEILNDDSLRRRRVFAPAGVQRLLKSVKEGSTDGAYSILAIICLESWFRQFLD